jgi:hypothetical protein
MAHSETPGETPGGARLWRVRPDLMVLKAAGAAVFAAVAVFAAAVTGDRLGTALAGIAAVALAAFALRDLVAPVRLAAGPGGVTVVAGFARRVRLPWPEIRRVEATRHARYGLSWSLLEIETAEGLHLIGSAELGAPCEQVAQDLTRLRREVTAG